MFTDNKKNHYYIFDGLTYDAIYFKHSLNNNNIKTKIKVSVCLIKKRLKKC